ncbi:MAG: SLC13 family permease [Pseudomonadales bacterium]|nr:SLC13 family permease [Pseudomonadales bacterium]
MDWQAWAALYITFSALLTLIFSRISPHIVMMAALSVLSVTGILSPSEALSGFANDGLMTVAAMFVIAAGIHGSGGVDLLVNALLGKPSSARAAMQRMFPPVVLLSGFLNNTPIVATMIPAINSWSRKINIAPSKLMIPLSYSAILGGTLTLIGTSTNLVVNGQYQALTGQPSLGLFSITMISLPVVIAGLLFIWLVFPKILPDRSAKNAFANLREFTLEVSVAQNGPLVGKTVEQAGLRNLRRVYLVEIERNGSIVTAVPSQEVLKGGDRLVFAGDTEAISDLLRINGITASANDNHEESLSTDRAERRLVEAVVSPHCDSLGQAIRDMRFRDRYGAAVLAVARGGERIKGNLGTIKLAAGDTLLLEARPAFVSRQRYNKDFLLINELEEAPPRHERAYLSWAILLCLIVSAGFGVISMLNAALIGAAAMIIFGCCSISQAEKSLDFSVILTIAASFSLGTALQKTGAAGHLAHHIIDLSGGTPWLMLILVYIAVVMLTETITNNAAAIIMLPIVLQITQQAGIDAEPFIFAIMMAASASFITPLGYQTNLMVYGPGGYKFTDFIKVGLPLSIFLAVVTLSILLLYYPL